MIKVSNVPRLHSKRLALTTLSTTSVVHTGSRNCRDDDIADQCAAYGMTESSGATHMHAPGDGRSNTVGTVIQNTQFKVSHNI